MRLDAGKAIRDAMRGQRDWDATKAILARLQTVPGALATEEEAALIARISRMGLTPITHVYADGTRQRLA